MPISIATTVKKYPKNLPFEEMATAILGKKYEISLTFIGSKRAQSLNQSYRQKSYTPNILSFPLTGSVGEIFICPAVTNREAKKFDLTQNGYIGFLFIHGCLHLKGLAHGARMEELEAKYLKQFKLK